MGLTAGVHAISRRTYEAALASRGVDFVVDSSCEVLDLDKAWHAIHYLATGDASLTFLLSGKQIAGVLEHCEVHSPESVSALHAAMAARPVESIMAGFQPVKFSALKIYPGDSGWTDGSATYIEHCLRQFINKLGEFTHHRLGMLVVIH